MLNLSSITKYGKRLRYLVQSSFIVVLLFLKIFQVADLSNSEFWLISFGLLVVGTFILHYPNIRFTNIIQSLVLPSSLYIGAYLALTTYSTLGLLTRMAALLSFGVIYYVISLADNVFLVVHDRDESIPLYRAAASWSQVLIIIVCLPIFGGLFKIGISGIYLSVLLGSITSIFLFYELWVMRFDTDAKRTGVGENIFLASIGAFFVIISTLAVSFLPGESFLRALTLSTVLLFSLNFVISYLKNDLSLKILVQYFFIIIIFFLLQLFFTAW